MYKVLLIRQRKYWPAYGKMIHLSDEYEHLNLNYFPNLNERINGDLIVQIDHIPSDGTYEEYHIITTVTYLNKEEMENEPTTETKSETNQPRGFFKKIFKSSRS